MFFENDGLKLFYEEFGNEEKTPILFLNGIMMSTPSWYMFKPMFKNYRIILFDFRDQGQSDKATSQYTIDAHIDDVYALLDHLGIDKINIVGLSYGGYVAAKFATKYSEKIQSLILANTVSEVTEYLSGIGKAWIEAAKLNDSDLFFTFALPFIHSRNFYKTNKKWVTQREKMLKKELTKEWFDSFIRLSQSTNGMNITEELSNISCETLLIGADQDIITPLEDMRKLHDNIKDSSFVIIRDAGHAAFLEKSKEFASLIRGFIN